MHYSILIIVLPIVLPFWVLFLIMEHILASHKKLSKYDEEMNQAYEYLSRYPNDPIAEEYYLKLLNSRS